MAEPTNPTIHMQSGVSAFTREPFITLNWGEQSGQLTVEEARAHAFAILETCEGAESDAFLFNWAIDGAGFDAEHASLLLVAFREYREGKQPPPAIPDNEK